MNARPRDVVGGARAPRPRHCMVVHAYYPLGETRVQREAEALVDAGWDVDVICLRDVGERRAERYRGVDVHRLDVRLDKRGLGRQLVSYVRFLLRATVKLARLDRRARYRSVQVHNLPDFLVFCALVPKLHGVPVILDLHDLMPEFFAARFGSGRLRRLEAPLRWQERLACGFADHVITVSEHWRQALIGRGVDAEKISVVMNVADERIFTPRSPVARDDDGLRLLYHGTLTERYGLDLAIRAVATLRGEIPGLRLTILGTGDHMGALDDLRRALELEGSVELRDELVLAEELPPLLAAADVGIVPYRDDVFTDGLLPTKLMEYAAVGLPCIAARTTAIEAYFRDAMVELFEPGDVEDLARCIRLLWRDPDRRRELAGRSRRFTDRYNWVNVGGAYVDLVVSLAGRARARARRSRPYQQIPS